MAQPLRIMSLHALAYCERLFYLEEVEETRMAHERVYAGRQLHVEIDKKEDQRTRKGNGTESHQSGENPQSRFGT